VQAQGALQLKQDVRVAQAEAPAVRAEMPEAVARKATCSKW